MDSFKIQCYIFLLKLIRPEIVFNLVIMNPQTNFLDSRNSRIDRYISPAHSAPPKFDNRPTEHNKDLEPLDSKLTPTGNR